MDKKIVLEKNNNKNKIYYKNITKNDLIFSYKDGIFQSGLHWNNTELCFRFYKGNLKEFIKDNEKKGFTFYKRIEK